MAAKNAENYPRTHLSPEQFLQDMPNRLLPETARAGGLYIFRFNNFAAESPEIYEIIAQLEALRKIPQGWLFDVSFPDEPKLPPNTRQIPLSPEGVWTETSHSQESDRAELTYLVGYFMPSQSADPMPEAA